MLPDPDAGAVVVLTTNGVRLFVIISTALTTVYVQNDLQDSD